ncbi:restriction endonuclease [Streptomyces sp. NBC_00453]|uniref:restriction endonuclease n=1 Tax=Streptomyces sp. NBC_00453 TaxID=2903653 RepID=UPI002E1E0EC6
MSSRVSRRGKSLGKEFWRKFEEEVELAVSKLGNAVVQRDVQVPGVLSGRPRQIDVLATGVVAGCEMTVIFEAKCYRGSVQIGTIDELVGKSLDVAAQSAVLYAPNGFSAGAKARAAGTQGSPLRVGVVDLQVDWQAPRQDAAGAARGIEVPAGALRFESPFDSWGCAAAAEPPAHPDYGRFFRGEAPLLATG